MHLGAPCQLHPLASALLDRRVKAAFGDDDIAAEREDLRFVVVRVDHRDPDVLGTIEKSPTY
jgi:hypothetical protein